jgi:hypothetical protein
MKVIRRIAIFASISLLSFFIGVALTRLRPHMRSHEIKPSPWQVLLSFENEDLEGLKDERLNAVISAVEAITGNHDSNELRPYHPALFRSISNSKGEQRYLLVEDSPLVEIPGESRLRVHVFDTAGRLLSTDDFNAGWRMVVTGMRVRDNDQIQQENLIVQSEYVFGGSSATHFYALIGDRLELIYGTAVIHGDWLYQPQRNSYGATNNTVGPRIFRSADEWEKALNSNANVEVLSALMWLAGSHSDGKEQSGPFAEDRTEFEKFSALRARETVQRRVKELSEVDDQADLTKFWIKAAAGMVFRDDILDAIPVAREAPNRQSGK